MDIFKKKAKLEHERNRIQCDVDDKRNVQVTEIKELDIEFESQNK